MFRSPSCFRIPTLLVTRLNRLAFIANTSSSSNKKYFPETKKDFKSEHLIKAVCKIHSQVNDQEQTDGDSSVSSVLNSRSDADLLDSCRGLSKNYWSTSIKLSSTPKKKAIPNLYSTSPVSLIANSPPINLYHGSIVNETKLWGNLIGKSTSRAPFETTRYRMKLPKINSYRNGNISLIKFYSDSKQIDLKGKLTDAKEKLVIIDFFAKWCHSCNLIAPYIEELKNEFPDVVILKVDVDEYNETAMEYNIKSMPTFVFVKSHYEVDRFSGVNKDKLKEILMKNK